MSVVSCSNQYGKHQHNKGRNYLLAIILAIGVGLLIYHLLSGDDLPSPIVTDADGNEMLSPERQRKLDRELREIDNAIQYALLATANKYYPCYSCPDGSKTIFLNIGEAWKYGSTRVGETRRYPNKNYGASDLTFLPQFHGTYTECLKMEKIKIYNYPLLPEAKKRKIRLFRPPGNTYDN